MAVEMMTLATNARRNTRTTPANRTVPAVLCALLWLAGAADRAVAQGVTAAQSGAAGAQQSTPAAPASPGGGLFTEPAILGKGVEFVGSRLDPSGEPKDGFYPELGNMITGSGWISAGPGYRHKFLEGRGLFDTSAAISWRAYKIVQARVEFRPRGDDKFAVGTQVFWQDATQVRYYGLGSDSLKSNASSYRLTDVDTIGYARVHPTKWFTLTGGIGWLREPDIDNAAGPFKSGYVDTRQLFGQGGAPGILAPAGFFHGGLSATVDTRDAGHATRGGLYRVGWAGYNDRDSGQFSFQRYEAEAAQFIPLGSPRWVLAMHGWIVGSSTADGKQVPVYLMPSLGGGNTLRGFADYRFHDRSLVLFSAESRWALFEHVDAVLFADAGNVASRVGDLNFDKTSYGVGVRVHTQQSTIGRLDIGHSSDGWRVLFKLDDPFALSRLSRRTATVPFVP